MHLFLLSTLVLLFWKSIAALRIKNLDRKGGNFSEWFFYLSLFVIWWFFLFFPSKTWNCKLTVSSVCVLIKGDVAVYIFHLKYKGHGEPKQNVVLFFKIYVFTCLIYTLVVCLTGYLLIIGKWTFTIACISKSLVEKWYIIKGFTPVLLQCGKNFYKKSFVNWSKAYVLRYIYFHVHQPLCF